MATVQSVSQKANTLIGLTEQLIAKQGTLPPADQQALDLADAALDNEIAKANQVLNPGS